MADNSANETVAWVLREHVARPVGSSHCVCGWRPAMSFNDTESDRDQHRYHQAAAVVAALGANPQPYDMPSPEADALDRIADLWDEIPLRPDTLRVVGKILHETGRLANESGRL